ncbi:MAG TPA: PspC domain-containing protein, partial [Flavobacteriales bacterium]|nr:PspC domain-containing protein [Flavobacteriales bacterium]
MKKTVTANIAGTVFHIEEDAYDRLQRYLAGIRANFGGNAAEIMGDIESRIAELFNARLINRSVVTLEDVEHVESVMGRPEDFAGEGAPGVPPPGATGSKRFLRDPDDKWLGGVLGGLGAYLGMDPLWLRIAVIVLVMASVGSVIPLYLLLWILVPRADSAADRLRMRGEPVTVENIKRTVEEGASRFAKEAGDLGKDWGPRARDWGQAAGAQMRNAGSGARHALRRIVGLALVVIGFGMFLSLVTGWVGSSMSLWHFATWNNDGMGLLELGQLAFNSRTQAVWAGIGLFVLLAVPVIGLLLSGFNLLLNTRAPGWLGWSLAVIWIAALIPLAMACVDVGRDFRRGST